MRIVLDASVLIAAIGRPGVCTELVDEVAREHSLILSSYILGEVERKLREKFNLSAADAASLVAGIRGRGQVVEPEAVPLSACRDPNDLPILGTCLAGNAEVLITVDKDLLSLGRFLGVSIIKPGDFWAHGQRQPQG